MPPKPQATIYEQAIDAYDAGRDVCVYKTDSGWRVSWRNEPVIVTDLGSVEPPVGEVDESISRNDAERINAEIELRRNISPRNETPLMPGLVLITGTRNGPGSAPIYFYRVGPPCFYLDETTVAVTEADIRAISDVFDEAPVDMTRLTDQLRELAKRGTDKAT